MILKHRRLPVGFLVALSWSAPAISDDGAQKNQAVAQDTASMVRIGNKLYPSNKMVCKREAKTGTRIKSKTCLLARQWYQLELDGQAMTDDMQSGINSTQH